MQQQRAAFALREVKKALDDPQTKKKEFNSYASSLPAMILMNGLGQAAAFYFSKGGTHHRLYDILSGWLISSGQPYEGETSLLDGITSKDMYCYRVAQAEALLFLDWVKKFAKAYTREA